MDSLGIVSGVFIVAMSFFMPVVVHTTAILEFLCNKHHNKKTQTHVN